MDESLVQREGVELLAVERRAAVRLESRWDAQEREDVSEDGHHRFGRG